MRDDIKVKIQVSTITIGILGVFAFLLIQQRGANRYMEAQLRQKEADELKVREDRVRIAAQAVALASEKQMRARALLLPALCSVPHKHQARLTHDVIPILDFLSYPTVSNRVGAIHSISARTAWTEKKAVYTGASAVGEQFGISIDMERLPNPIVVHWETFFPPTIQVYDISHRTLFVNGRFSLSAVLHPVLEHLTRDDLSEIATGYRDPEVRKAAVAAMNSVGDGNRGGP